MTTRQAAEQALKELGYSDEQLEEKMKRVDALCLKNSGPVAVAQSYHEVELLPGQTEQDLVDSFKHTLVLLGMIGPEEGRFILDGMKARLVEKQQQN